MSFVVHQTPAGWRCASGKYGDLTDVPLLVASAAARWWLEIRRVWSGSGVAIISVIVECWSRLPRGRDERITVSLL